MDEKNSRQGKELKTLNEINEGLGELLGRSSSLVSGEKSQSGESGADGSGAQGSAGSNTGSGSQGGAGRAGAGGSGVLRQATDIKTGTYKKRRPFRLHGAVIFLLVLVFLVGAGAGTVWFLREQGKRSLLEHEGIEGVEITAPDDAIIAEDGQIVRYNGKTYQRNMDVISVLCMGIDKDADEVYKDMMEQLSIGEKGQADTIFIAALDTGTGELNLINISRDAMIGVDIYNVDGEYVRTEEMQVCLAYAYGKDSESSSRNEMRSVSRLMYGMPLDAYAAIDIPAISVLNDAVGGVQVTVLEDLSSRDPELVKGNVVTLKGNQATTYVRSRDFNALDANNLRMQRQRQYVTAFIRQVMAKARQNISIVLTLYQAVQAYMSTDIDVARLTYLVSLALQREFTDANIMNVAGEVVKGKKFTEYHVDETALYELILKIYYNEVDDDGNIIIPEDIAVETEIEEPQEEESEKIITIDRDVLI